MKYRQFYSLLAILSCEGSIKNVIDRLKRSQIDSVYVSVSEARFLLEKYVECCNKKEFKPGNGYIDLVAARKTFDDFGKFKRE